MAPVDSAFDTLGGLPIHALVVHAVVVLVPLTALGAILMVAWTDFCRRFGPVVVIMGGVAVMAAIIAKEAGEQLALRVGVPAEHEEYGSWMPVAAGILFVLVLGFWLVDRGIPLNRSRPGWLIAVGVLLVLVAFGAIALTFVVGHTGTQAVWSGVIRSTGGG